MAVYAGILAYKGSRNHPAGESIVVKGATDNLNFARIFGVDGNIEYGRELQAINLFPNNEKMLHFVPKCLTQVDDLEYLREHADSIVNWEAASAYLFTYYRAKMIQVFERVTGEHRENFSNDLAVALSRYVLGVGNEQRISDTNSFDEEKSSSLDTTKDEIGRRLIFKNKPFCFEVHGLDFRGEIREKHFLFSNDTNQLIIEYVVQNLHILGNKGSITRVKDKQKQIKQFQFFRRITKRFEATNFQTKGNINDLSLDDRFQKDSQEFVEKLRSQLLGLSPLEAGLPEFSDFNIATAYERLWEELGLSSSEIERNGLPEETLRAYVNKEITAKQVLEMNKKLFANKLKKALVKRFSQYANSRAYADSALEKLQGKIEPNSQNKALAIKNAEKVLGMYTNAIKNLTQLNDLLVQYEAPAFSHNREIVDKISELLLSEASNPHDDEPSTEDIKAGFQTYLREAGIKINDFEHSTKLTVNQVTSRVINEIRNDLPALRRQSPKLNINKAMRDNPAFQDQYFIEFLDLYEDTQLQIAEEEERLMLSLVKQYLNNRSITDLLFARATGHPIEEVEEQVFSLHEAAELNELFIEKQLAPFVLKCEAYAAEMIKDRISDEHTLSSAELAKIPNYPIDNCRVITNQLTLADYLKKHFPEI